MSESPSGEPSPGKTVQRAIKRYLGDVIHVTYDGLLCIHAAECVRGLPAVFDTKRRPWILPTAAAADEIAAVIERCPTGALHYERVDGGAAEVPDQRNTITVRANGPYYMRGRLRIVTAEGSLVIDDVRLALCRCGQSQHKPFCDNAHLAAGFRDAGQVASDATLNADAALSEHGELSIKLRKNGPLKLQGNFELIGVSSTGGEPNVYRADEAVLCRCGGSATKPFCDGAHRNNGFEG